MKNYEYPGRILDDLLNGRLGTWDDRAKLAGLVVDLWEHWKYSSRDLKDLRDTITRRDAEIEILKEALLHAETLKTGEEYESL